MQHDICSAGLAPGDQQNILLVIMIIDDVSSVDALLNLQKNLQALIKFQLSIGHLGHKGDLMFARFLSVNEGFQVFSKSKDSSEPSRVAKELNKWRTVDTFL